MMMKNIINLKKTSAHIAIVCFQLLVFSSFAQYSGTTGSLTWELNIADSTLTILGNDTMPDYLSNGAISTCPWFNLPIATVVIGDGVKSIGNYAFNNCFILTSVSIPNSVTTIGENAFNNCNKLTSISIPNFVTTIGKSAFSSSGLTSVSIPNSVITIGYGAFTPCRGLKYVSIGNSVTTIGSGAFATCPNLDSIICKPSVPPAIGSYTTFYDVPKTIPIYVPCGTIEAYQAADNWKEFTNFQTIGFPSPEDVEVLQQSNALEVSWQDMPNALRYELYRNNALLTTVSATTYNDSAVSNNVTYCYKLKAIYESCTSGFSGEACQKYSGVSISNYKLDNTDYMLFPNPTTGQLTIESGQLTIENIEIVDITGKIVKTYSPVNNTINVSELPNGIYFMRIYSKKQKIVRKFVKQ